MEQIIQQQDMEYEEFIDTTMTSNAKKDDEYSSDISVISLYLKEIGQYPVLTPVEEIELAQKIAKGDNRAKEKFINSNLRLVVYTARRYKHTGLDLLDLIQDGNIGLLKAVDAFDYTRGVKFSTYATYWIKQEILRAIYNKKELIRIPINMQVSIKQYQTIQDNYLKKYMRNATDIEISTEMNISIEEVAEIKSFIYNTVSLNKTVSSDGETELGDFIVDTDLTPEEVMLENFDKEFWDRLLENSNLDAREKLIIKMRYGFENETCAELKTIAERLGISKERVRVLELRAIKKLKYTIINQYKEIFV